MPKGVVFSFLFLFYTVSLSYQCLQYGCCVVGDTAQLSQDLFIDVFAEALLAAIIAPVQTPPQAAAPPSNDPWSGGSAAFGESAQGVSSGVLQPLPGFGDLQQAAGQMQQLLMAGHRLEALRQAAL